MKVFADGGDLKGIEEMMNNPMIDGFTSNPALTRKSGVTNYEQFAKDAIKIVGNKPFSFEVIADDFSEMERQANKIASWSDSVYVKIPVTNTLGISSCNLIEKLSLIGMKINVTAILSEKQIRDVSKILCPKTPSIISIFAGRISDTGKDATQFIFYANNMKTSYKHEILWASVREVYNYIQARDCRADIITIPNDIIKKMSLIGKDLDQYSLETVSMFRNDAIVSGFEL